MARLRGERGRAALFFTSGDRAGCETAWSGAVASSGNCRGALSVIGAIGFDVMVRCPSRCSNQTALADCQSGVGKLIEAAVAGPNDLIGLGHYHASFVTGSRCASSSTSTRLFSE
jgi:hypothetical protein